MSGGSFDYLFCKDGYELLETHNIKTLEDMERELISLKYDDVAKDFRRLIEYIYSARNRVDVLADMLKPIMHDIEWYCSADISEDSLAETIEKYRKGDMRGEEC